MSGEVSKPAGGGKPVNWRPVIFTAAFATVSAAEYTALLLWPGVALQDKVTAVFALIGAYGLGLGFFRNSAALGAAGKNMIKDLTAPHAHLVLTANMTFLSALSLMIGIAVDRHKSPPQSLPLYIISTIVLLPMVLVVIVYAFFHIFVVVPVTYPAVVVASAVVDSYEKATADASIILFNKENETAFRQSLKAFVLNDKAASTAYIMGLPAAALALASQVFAAFL